MKHTARWVKAAFLVAALGASGVARAQSTGAPASSGTGIPQFAEPPVGSPASEAEPLTVNAQDQAAPPQWYSVSAAGARAVLRTTPDLQPLDAPPRWYTAS